MTQQKNILFIIDSLGGGGAERVLLTLSRTLHNQGHRIVVLSVQNFNEYEIDFDIQLLTLDFTKNNFERTYKKYARRLRRLVNSLEAEHGIFDLIVSNLQISNRLIRFSGLHNFFMCVHSALSPGSLGERRGLRRHIKKKRLQKLFAGQNIITVAQAMKTDLEQVINIKARSIRVIYNPVDFKLIRSLACEPNPFHNEQYIICVARLTGFKRHDRLLQAYAMSNLPQKLLLLGDGPLRSDLENLACELGIRDRVIFAGFHRNPYPIIKGSILSVLSSDYEGLGMGIIESLALNVPVVSTDCISGPREILVGDLARFLVPVDDIDALCHKMYQAVKESTGPGVYIDPTTLEKFDARRVANQYLDLANRRRIQGSE